MSKALSELNALCDVLSYMRTSKATDSTNQMYKHFCKPGDGVICVHYLTDRRGRIFNVHFKYITWLAMVSNVSIDTTKYY